MSLFPPWEVSHLQVKFLWTATGTTESNCITFSTFPDQLFDSPRVLGGLRYALRGRDVIQIFYSGAQARLSSIREAPDGWTDSNAVCAPFPILFFFLGARRQW
jgi:hypothetical protein